MMACGARSGKDRLSVYLCVEFCLRLALARRHSNLVPKVNCWVVAPTFALTNQWWHELEAAIPPSLIVSKSRRRYIRLLGDIVIQIKSADRPELLVAEGVDLLFGTEMARCRDNRVWYESLLPRLASPGRFGLALLNSSPRCNKDHFFRQMWDGIKASDALRRDEYQPQFVTSPDGLRAGWNLPSTCNPEMIPQIPSLRAQMTEKYFRSEILAEWMDDGDKVFDSTVVRKMFVGAGSQLSGRTIISVDPARTHDAFACMAMCPASHQVIDIDASHGLQTQHQLARLRVFVERHSDCEIVVDATSAHGMTWVDLISEALPEVPLHKVDLHGIAKDELILQLVNAVETGKIRVRSDLVSETHCEQLSREMLGYEAETTKSGNVRYSGRQDDYVITLGLCWSRARREDASIDAFDIDRFWEGKF